MSGFAVFLCLVPVVGALLLINGNLRRIAVALERSNQEVITADGPVATTPIRTKAPKRKRPVDSDWQGY